MPLLVLRRYCAAPNSCGPRYDRAWPICCCAALVLSAASWSLGGYFRAIAIACLSVNSEPGEIGPPLELSGPDRAVRLRVDGLIGDGVAAAQFSPRESYVPGADAAA